MKLLVIFVGIFSQISAITFNCDFKMEKLGDHPNPVYSCAVTSVDFVDNPILTEVFGDHHEGKSNEDVQDILFFSLPNLSIIPREMENYFPDLIAIYIANCNINRVFGDELSAYENLQWFWLKFNPNLEKIPGGLFANNLKLKHLWLNNNQLKSVGINLLESLENLKSVNFDGNKCISKEAKNSAEVPGLIEDLQNNCVDTKEIVNQKQILMEKNEELNAKVEELSQKFEELGEENSKLYSEISKLTENMQEIFEKNSVIEEIVQENSEFTQKLEKLSTDYSKVKKSLTKIQNKKLRCQFEYGNDNVFNCW